MASMNFNLTGRGDLKRISAILEQMREQQNKRIAETIELAKSSPVPWPAELVHRISFTMNDDFDEVMTHHPGHKIFNAHESIKFFLDLFDDTYKQLENANLRKKPPGAAADELGYAHSARCLHR